VIRAMRRARDRAHARRVDAMRVSAIPAFVANARRIFPFASRKRRNS
jgi:hypothetical protein